MFRVIVSLYVEPVWTKIVCCDSFENEPFPSKSAMDWSSSSGASVSESEFTLGRTEELMRGEDDTLFINGESIPITKGTVKK